MTAYKKFDSQAFLDRLTKFGQDCQKLTIALPKNQYNLIYSSQIIRSSSSPAANYIEAIESLGKKDFVMKLRITRKETRESIYWLNMIKESNLNLFGIQKLCDNLANEGDEIVRILTSSILTLEQKNS